MEGKVFPSPAVAAELTSHFIEARLHADFGSYAETVKALREEMTGSVALPIYVVMDPETGEVGGILEGLRFAPDFKDFLTESRAKLGM
ncbi:MAG: hypothetical protein ACI8QC_003774 [Planctomycetota bacterium]|jgi:hypothetical protein